DADVVLHAVTDALLGAAGLGDIGDHFPDTDPVYRNADSARFLMESLDKLRKAGWQPINADVIIFAQEPKLGPVKADIRHRLPQRLGVDGANVNVKAKTGEHVGPVGRGEAVECLAAILIDRRSMADAPSRANE